MTIHQEAAPATGETMFETRIQSDLGLLAPLAIRVTSELASRGCISEEDRDKIEVCCEEALKNAIVHGNRENPGLVVSVRLFREGEGWGILVQDQGKGFQDRKLPDPEDPMFPWRDSGRGIHLMRHLMDSVEFYAGGKQVVLSRRSGTRGSRKQEPAAAPSRTAAVGTVAAAAATTMTTAPATRAARPVATAQPAGPQPAARTIRDGVVVARPTLPAGDQVSVDAAFKRLHGAVQTAHLRVLVIDLGGVPYLSSHALGRLVALCRTCQRLKTSLRVAGANPEVRAVFAQMRLEAILPCFDRVEDAATAKVGPAPEAPGLVRRPVSSPETAR
ncbi:MAG: ATP-binding protein [Planctomycetes bacterium]|nr:ATP-binding protein [Planctomycetota bacterium]